MTDIQCALGVSQLKKLDTFIQRRRMIADLYSQALSGISEIQLPREDSRAKSSWHLYSVWIKNKKLRKKRGEIFMRLRKNGIGVQVHYIPVYLQPFYQKLGYPRGLCPQAEAFYEGEISLPLFPAMTQEDIDCVIRHTVKAFKDIAQGL